MSFNFKCFFKGHDWTCKAKQGIKPSPDELRGVAGFYHYARMYCARCGKQSELNK